MNLFRSVCNYLTGNKRTLAIQSDIISSYERELVETKQYAEDLSSQLESCRVALRNKTQDNDILQSCINELNAKRRGLELDIRNLQNRPEPVVEQFVMTQGVYDKFVRGLEPPIVTNNTTAQGAGYLVGMQRVLGAIREQFVTR